MPGPPHVLGWLQAAIAVVTDGREALKKHKDPFGDGPFEYKALQDGGFELKSKVKIPEKGPVTLTVGRTPKPEASR